MDGWWQEDAVGLQVGDAVELWGGEQGEGERDRGESE